MFIQFAFRWLLIAIFGGYSSFSLHLRIWNLVILNVINLTNSKIFFLRLPIFFLPILKKRRCIIKNYQSISLCIPFSRCVLQSFWNRAKKVDSTVNATNRRGTGISGRGPSQYRTQNESQSMPILPEETTRENTFIEQQNDDQ